MQKKILTVAIKDEADFFTEIQKALIDFQFDRDNLWMSLPSVCLISRKDAPKLEESVNKYINLGDRLLINSETSFKIYDCKVETSGNVKEGTFELH